LLRVRLRLVLPLLLMVMLQVLVQRWPQRCRLVLKLFHLVRLLGVLGFLQL
jgi:hypothetical protein